MRKENLTITKEQTEKLQELKITMLTNRVLYTMAKEQYEQAEKTEKQAEKNALAEYNKQNKTNYEVSYLITDDKDFNEYLKILQLEYKKMGIENELNKVYSYPFLKNFVKAEKQYLLNGCDFLEICGKHEESEEIKKAINTYLPEKFKQQLLELNDKYICGLTKKIAD